MSQNSSLTDFKDFFYRRHGKIDFNLQLHFDKLQSKVR